MSVLNLQPLGSPWGVLHGGAPTHRWWPRCVASSCPAPRRADWPTGPIYSQTAVCPPADGGAAPKIKVNPHLSHPPPPPRGAAGPPGPFYSQPAVGPPADGGAAPKIRVNPDVADAAHQAGSAGDCFPTHASKTCPSTT